MRWGSANTVRGTANFLAETIARVRSAGAAGPPTLRADSGFYAHDVVAACRRLDVRFSVTLRIPSGVRRLIEAIPEDAWRTAPGSRSRPSPTTSPAGPRLGLGEGIVTTKTLCRRLFGLVGRLTRSARRLTLHLPTGWPWAAEFLSALARLRALPLLA